MSRLLFPPHRTFALIRRSLAVSGFLLCALLAVTPAIFAASPSPESVMDSVTAAIAVEKAGQERGRQWEQEQARLLEEIRQARLEAAWYALQVETFSRYVATARERVATQQQTRKELERMEAELEGELLLASQALEQLVAQDIPFLTEERSRRLDFIHKTLGDYELASAEKLRRVLEAMQAEYAYGNTADVSSGVITVSVQDKKASSQRVTLIRAGRVGLFALAPDASCAWGWTADKGFLPLNEKESAALAALAPMLEAKSVRILPLLPFAAPLSNTTVHYPEKEHITDFSTDSTEARP